MLIENRKLNKNLEALVTRAPSNKMVSALFTTRECAMQAVAQLQKLGLRGDQISLAMRERTRDGELVDSVASDVWHLHPDGAQAWHRFAGYLKQTRIITMPGLGPVIAAGELGKALALDCRANVLNALTKLGIADEQARYLDFGVRHGGVLVLVDAGQYEGRVMEILALQNEWCAGERMVN